MLSIVDDRHVITKKGPILSIYSSRDSTGPTRFTVKLESYEKGFGFKYVTPTTTILVDTGEHKLTIFGLKVDSVYR